MPDSSNDGEPTDRQQVTLNVNVDALERWDSYLDESLSYKHRSELIRHAVEREISGSQQDQPTSEEGIAEIKDGLRQLSNQVQDLHTTVDAIAERTKETPESIKELAHELFPLLPTRDELQDYRQAAIRAGDGIGDAHVGPDWTDSGRVEAFADRLDADEVDVRAALVQLQEETHRVQSVDVDGESRFYKEV